VVAFPHSGAPGRLTARLPLPSVWFVLIGPSIFPFATDFQHFRSSPCKPSEVITTAFWYSRENCFLLREDLVGFSGVCEMAFCCSSFSLPAFVLLFPQHDCSLVRPAPLVVQLSASCASFFSCKSAIGFSRACARNPWRDYPSSPDPPTRPRRLLVHRSSFHFPPRARPSLAEVCPNRMRAFLQTLMFVLPKGSGKVFDKDSILLNSSSN